MTRGTLLPEGRTEQHKGAALPARLLSACWGDERKPTTDSRCSLFYLGQPSAGGGGRGRTCSRQTSWKLCWGAAFLQPWEGMRCGAAMWPHAVLLQRGPALACWQTQHLLWLCCGHWEEWGDGPLSFIRGEYVSSGAAEPFSESLCSCPAQLFCGIKRNSAEIFILLFLVCPHRILLVSLLLNSETFSWLKGSW